MSLLAFDQIHSNAREFCCLLTHFHTDRIPTALFVRACSSKRVWLPTGEIVERRPQDALVPTWLMQLFNDDSSSELPVELREAVEMQIFDVIVERSASYLTLRQERQEVLNHETLASGCERRLFDLLSIIVHGFPQAM